MTHATPRPWKVTVLDGEVYINPDRRDGEYALIAKVIGKHNNEHAALIVHAVNTLDEAKAALCLAGQVLDSMLNGQGLEADNMDKALMAINHAIAKMDAQ